MPRFCLSSDVKSDSQWDLPRVVKSQDTLACLQAASTLDKEPSFPDGKHFLLEEFQSVNVE